LSVLIASLDDDTRLRWRRALSRSFAVQDRGGIAGVPPLLRDFKPAVLLLDLKLRRLGGVEGIRALQKASPSTKIIVVANTPRFREELAALKFGAAGYIGKDIGTKLLRKAVRLVQTGEVWTRRKIVAHLIDELTAFGASRSAAADTPSRNSFDGLTIKKRQIIRSIADGLSNSEIAERLHISEATVKAHLTAIYRRFDVANRTQLATFAATDANALSARPLSKHG
jgi:DNA-binding NarL/FixJ family response regulator